MEISELKRSKEFLSAVLGIEIKKKCKCPFHEDGTDSFSTFTREGIWFWKCHAGCGSGTIIDAAMLKYRVSTAKEAISRLGDELGQSFQSDVELSEVVLDVPRAEKLITMAHENLLNRFDLQEEFLLGKRGIENLEVVKKYRLGFMENLKLQGKCYTIPRTWVLPITDAAGKLSAVKLHTEGRWQFYAGKAAPKCLWAPFGVYPRDKPKHGLATLWPPPEDFIQSNDKKMIFLCPGELKALAEIAAGNPATAITAGESGIPERDVKRLRKCGFSIVTIVFDDDDKKKRPSGEWVSAGREWLKKVSEAVTKAGMQPVPFAASDRIPNVGSVAEIKPRSEILPACSPDVQDFDALDSIFKSGITIDLRQSIIAEFCTEAKRESWFSSELSFAELETLIRWEREAIEKGFV